MSGYKTDHLEAREGKVLMGTPGGNSGKGSSYYRVGIPPLWAKEMGISKEERDVRLTFDGKMITVEKVRKTY